MPERHEQSWNAENRLVKAENDSTKLEFTYDYMGRRIQKQVYAWDAASDFWSLTSDLRYVYDGWNLIQSLDAQDSNAGVKDFTWGLDLSQSVQGAGGVGGLLAVTEHGETADTPYYTTYDANGNISEYLDNTGAVAVHYEYSPFGRLTLVDSETGAPDFNHRFSTKFFDTETRLYYYGRRYYSSELGRWVNRDPIGERGGINVYAFVGNNALNAWDLLGLATNWIFDSYIMDYDLLNKDDIVVHHQFEIDVSCTRDGVAVNAGTVGPVVKEKSGVDESDTNGPNVMQINQKDLQVDWTGMVLEADMHGWTVGASTGGGLGLFLFGPTPDDLIYTGVGFLYGGIFEGIFDDEITWSYRRSAVFSCTCEDNPDGSYSYTVNMTEDPRPVFEEYKDNDWFDYDTKYSVK